MTGAAAATPSSLEPPRGASALTAENTGLTALRGLCVFVVLYHFSALSLGREYLDYSQFFRKAHLLIEVFFILSGYLICWLYGGAFAGRFRLSDYRSFLAKRLARIYPMHLATMLAMLALWWWRYGPPAGDLAGLVERLPWRPLLRHLTMTQSWWIDNPYTLNVPAWSVSVEWSAYIVFPLLLRAALRLAALGPLLAFALPLLGVTALSWMSPFDNLHVADIRGVARCWFDFTMGGTLYFLQQRRPDHPLWRIAGSDLGLAALFAALALAMHVGLHDVLIVAILLLIVAGASRARGRMGAFLAWGPINWAGAASYSIYLLHWPMMVLWWRLNGTELLTPAYFGPVADTALFLAAVLLVAGVTYPLIEVRGREFLRRVLAPGRGA